MVQRWSPCYSSPGLMFVNPHGSCVMHDDYATLETRCERAEDALRELGKQVAPACYEYNHRGDIRPMVNVLNAVIAAADALKGEK